ncbi:F-box only 7 [Brachionus plicatilis]|uniref:F-box only 7 n=1 Tax=Brachionus plicatilis TaxID=10195 RepID=A0A3M7RTV2_BRAPC|nr:F-box only 7 [Brachionus plicatilis]
MDMKNTLKKSPLNIEDYKSYLSEIDSNKQKLAYLIHLILLRENFCFLNDNGQKMDAKISNDEIYFTKLYYNHYQYKETFINLDNVLITLLKSGRFVDMNLKNKNFSSKFLKLNLDDFFADLSLDKIQNLELNFKNEVLIPFKIYLKSNFDLNIITGLSDLPIELIIEISLKYLDIRSIVKLSQTCRYFRKLLDSDGKIPFWQKLIARDFKQLIPLNTTDQSLLGSKREYIKLYKNSKRFKLFSRY